MGIRNTPAGVNCAPGVFVTISISLSRIDFGHLVELDVEHSSPTVDSFHSGLLHQALDNGELEQIENRLRCWTIAIL